MSSRRVVQAVLVIGALTTAAVFLALRGPERATAIAVYGRFPGKGIARPGTLPLLIESFDLNAHRAMPVRVREVLARGPSGESAMAFDLEGELPVILRVVVPDPAPSSLVIRGENESGSVEVVIPMNPGSRTAIAELPGPGIGWPIQVRCGDTRVVLLSEMGAPEVGVPGRVLALVEPVPHAATLSLVTGIEMTTVVLEPWGGGLVTWTPRTLRAMVRILLKGMEEGCEARTLLTAASRGVRVRDLTVHLADNGRYVLRASVTTRSTRLFALLASRDGLAGPGPLIDARAVPLREGRAEAVVALPGPGVYQVRFTGEPLESGPAARGADAIVVAGKDPARVEGLLRGWPHDLGTGKARDVALPFVLATLASSSSVTLTQVANTAAEVRATVGRERSRRDAGLLAILTLCLVGLVVQMAVEVVRGYRSRRLVEAMEEVGRIPVWKGVLPAILVGAVLLCAIAALILVLETL